MLKRFFFIFLFLCCGCFLKKKERKILNLSLPVSVVNLDPAKSYNSTAAQVLDNCYETLLSYHYLKHPYELKTQLALELPQYDAETFTYTFKIKKDLYYQPDPAFQNQKVPVVAQDFIYALKRQAFQKTQGQGYHLIKNKILGLEDFHHQAKSLQDFFSLPISGVKIIDPQKFQITLKEKHPEFLYFFTMAFSSPLPKEAIDYYQNDFSRHMVCTGPFQLASFIPDKEIKLLKNPHFREDFYPSLGDKYAFTHNLLQDAHKKVPFIEGITFHILPDPKKRWELFTAGKLDFLAMNKKQYHQLRTLKNEKNSKINFKKIHTQIVPSSTFWWFSFNQEDPVYGNNLFLRKAVAHALNRDAFIEKFTAHLGQKANSLYPPNILGFSPSHKLPYKFDREEAKKFLHLAGYSKNPPPLYYDTRNNSPAEKQMALFIKEQLQAMGITMIIRVNTYQDFLQKARQGKLQFWRSGWVLDYPDPENILQLLLSHNISPGSNYARYHNPKFDQYYQKYLYSDQKEVKKELLQKMQTLVHRDYIWIMGYYERRYIIAHPRLKNLRYSDLFYSYYKYLNL